MLDVGTSKVCCLIARTDGEGGPRVAGAGQHASAGLRNGTIVDVAAAEAAVRNAVHAAEQQLGETLRTVTVALAGARPTSRSVDIEVAIAGQAVGETDLRRVHEQSLAAGTPRANGTPQPAHELIHTIPTGFSIDGSRGIHDPRGLYGERLGVAMHVITAAAGPVRTLRTVVESCHLDIDQLVMPAFAAGLATLVEDEQDLGATVLDMGAGTTDIAVFYDGAVVFTDTVPLGGAHVTNDIARVLSTPVGHAERLKTLYGSAVATSDDDHEAIDVPQVGEAEFAGTNQVPRAIVNAIIGSRLEEIFEEVRARLTDGMAAPLAGRRLVLTGGASQLQGVRELAARILDKQVRLGRPLRLRGLADAMAGPAFATAAGLIAHQVDYPPEFATTAAASPGDPGGLAGRIGEWLRGHL